MIANTYIKLFWLSFIWHWVSFKFILQSYGQASKGMNKITQVDENPRDKSYLFF